MPWIADLLFPQSCVACGVLIRGGFCRSCLEALTAIEGSPCRKCGSPSESGRASCRECRGRDLRFDAARQYVTFEGPARRAILRLKFRGESSLAKVIAIKMAQQFPFEGRPVLTWVPAHRLHVVERGFDQAELLAKELAALTGLKIACLVERVGATRPQRGLDPIERRSNVQGAFRPKLPAPARVVVVDDVYTTGATASEVARTLKSSGAHWVGAVAFARTVRGSPRSYNDNDGHQGQEQARISSAKPQRSRRPSVRGSG